MTTPSRFRGVWQPVASGLVIQLCVFWLFVWMIGDELHLHGRVYYTVWPSVWLAQLGLTHSWVVSALLLPVFMAACIYGSIRRRQVWQWKQSLAVNAAGASLYLLGGWLALDAYPNPLPGATKFDDQPEQRRLYLEAYDHGYQRSKLGWMTTGPLSDRIGVDDIGRNDGQDAGGKAYERMLGSESRRDWLPSAWIRAARVTADVLDDTGAFLSLMWRCRPAWLGGESS